MEGQIIHSQQATTEQYEEPPRKILRLRVDATDTPLDFTSIDTRSSSCIESLVRLEAQLNTIKSDDVNEQLVVILDKLSATENAMIRTRLIGITKQLASIQQINVSMMMNTLLRLIKNSDSHSLKAELFMLCSFLVSLTHSDAQDLEQIIVIAKEGLNDSASSVRSAALKLVCEMIGISKIAKLSLEDTLGLQLIVIDYAHDPDPRVRCAALEMLTDLNVKGINLESNVYDEASKALSDDFELVRTAALRLISDLSRLTPEKLITLKGGGGQTIRMLDDGFTKICDCLNDLSYIVRVQAAQLMGLFVKVNQQFLEQTLDKKLMSNMRRKVSAHERQREFYASGEWASGNRFADDAPKEAVDEASVSLVPMGACGAFVHALEDEFMEVREAAVASMCSLAENNSSFASQAQDFLVDMFNDEIEDVRLHSIRSLKKMARHLSLRDDQVEVITGALKDFAPETRCALHRMIQESRLATQSGLRDMVLGLLDNLRRYPEDRNTIWRALQHLGGRHPGHVAPLLTELLSLHPYFDMPEPQMEDESYSAVMILVYNAAAVEPSISSLFPAHTIRHYHYHRMSLPKLVPALPQLESSKQCLKSVGSKSNRSSILSGVERQLQTLGNVAGHTARKQMLSLYLRDLKHVIDQENADYAKGQYISSYLQCLLLFTEVEQHRLNNEEKLVISLCQQIGVQCEKLLHLFNNVSVHSHNAVRQFQLISLSLVLCQSMDTGTAKPEDFKKYLRQLHKLKVTLKGQGSLLAFTTALLDAQDSFQAGNWSVLHKAVSDLDLSTLPLPSELDNVNMIMCELDQPQTRVDNPRTFTAGLAICLPVRAELKNINPAHKLCIRILMPDMREVTVPVKPHSLAVDDSNDNEHILTSQVTLSHGHWSEGSFAEVALCLITDDAHSRVDICKPNRVYLNTRMEKKAHSASLL